MTTEARLAFLLLFLFVWCSLGTIAWSIAAVWVRGRGALLAFPLALASSAALAVLVPLLGMRDLAGLLLSLPAAFAGGAAGAWGGIALSRRIDSVRAAADQSAGRTGASEGASDTLDT